MALSKTARASLLAGEGQSKRVATAWIFLRGPGLHPRPFKTFCGKEGKEEAKSFAMGDPEKYYVVAW